MSKELFLNCIDEVRENPVVTSIARQHHGKVPLAVGSGGQRSLVEASLNACGLLELFEAVVVGKTYKRENLHRIFSSKRRG